jgi:hypothetical protein
MMVLIITALVLVMAGTGTMLKFGSFGLADLGMVRYIHNNLSPFLTLVLVVMIVTGGAMYLTPWLVKWGKPRA